jgi:Tfp pilus assembly PilM family ATPase
MTWRRYVGVDIHDTQLRIAALRKRWRKGGLPVDGRVVDLQHSLEPARLRELDSGQRTGLLAALHDAIQTVAVGEKRIALSLPDRCGYVLPMEIEGFPRLRGEGMAMIDWQLKKLLPGCSGLQFDYQVLKREPGNPTRLLVIAAEKSLLGLYQELLQDAGFSSVHVSFHGLNLYRHWRYRLDPEGDAILVVMTEDGVNLQIYRAGRLEYYNSRRTGAESDRQVQELHRIVAGYAREFSGRIRHRLFLHADRGVERSVVEAINECFGRKAEVLEGHGDSPLVLAAALGAAECLMMGD